MFDSGLHSRDVALANSGCPVSVMSVLALLASPPRSRASLFDPPFSGSLYDPIFLSPSLRRSLALSVRQRPSGIQPLDRAALSTLAEPGGSGRGRGACQSAFGFCSW